jgi:MPBQ/MSBQ methyltransferase
LHVIGRWLFKRWAQKPIAEGLAARMIFDSYLCYEIQLWQLSEDDCFSNRTK